MSFTDGQFRALIAKWSRIQVYTQIDWSSTRSGSTDTAISKKKRQTPIWLNATSPATTPSCLPWKAAPGSELGHALAQLEAGHKIYIAWAIR